MSRLVRVGIQSRMPVQGSKVLRRKNKTKEISKTKNKPEKSINRVLNNCWSSNTTSVFSKYTSDLEKIYPLRTFSTFLEKEINFL